MAAVNPLNREFIAEFYSLAVVKIRRAHCCFCFYLSLLYEVALGFMNCIHILKCSSASPIKSLMTIIIKSAILRTLTLLCGTAAKPVDRPVWTQDGLGRRIRPL